MFGRSGALSRGLDGLGLLSHAAEPQLAVTGDWTFCGWLVDMSVVGRLYFSSSLAKLLRGVVVETTGLVSCNSSCFVKIIGRKMRSLPVNKNITVNIQQNSPHQSSFKTIYCTSFILLTLSWLEFIWHFKDFPEITPSKQSARNQNGPTEVLTILYPPKKWHFLIC